MLNNYVGHLTHLKGDDKAEEKSHVDDTEDDCLLKRNKKKECSTRQNPVLAEFVPHPATYTNAHNAHLFLSLVIINTSTELVKERKATGKVFVNRNFHLTSLVFHVAK